jgi:hypothetical protein
MKELSEILKSYSANNWEDWIDDIVHFQLAYPISNISGEKDDLAEIVTILQRLNLSTKYYEVALADTLNKLLPIRENAVLIERILNVLLVIKSSKSKEYVLKLFFQDKYNSLQGKEGFLISKALNVLSRFTLNDEEKSRINERIIGLGNIIGIFKNDVHFITNYLRFVRLHIDEKSFYNSISLIIPKCSKLTLDDVLMDATYELYFDKKEYFYKNMFQWIVNDYSRLSDSKIYHNILRKIKHFINHANRKKDLESGSSNQRDYYYASNYTLKLALRNKFIDPEKFGKGIELIEKLGGQKFLENIINEDLLKLQGFLLYNKCIMSDKNSYKLNNTFLTSQFEKANTKRIISSNSFEIHKLQLDIFKEFKEVKKLA